jgi:heme exporter protein D
MNTWIEMGGYGLYVWGSMGVVLLCFAVELLGLRLRLTSLLGKRKA